MPQQIEVPGMGVVEFPDGMSDEQISAAIQSNTRDQRRAQLVQQNPGEYDPNSPEFKAKTGGGLMGDIGRAAIRSPMVAGDAILNVGRNMLAAPIAGVAGAVSAPLGFIPGMEGVGARNIERVQGFLGGQPFTEAGQEVVQGMAYPLEKFAQGADWVGQKAADATGSPLVGTAANTAVQALPALLSRGRGRAAEAPKPVPKPVPKAASAVPSIDELQAAKNAAYKRAEETGVVVSRGAMNRLKVGLVNDLKKEGIHPKLHQKSVAAVEEILNTKGQPSLSQLETLRKIANDARMAPDAADARIGAKIIEHIDDFEDGLTHADVVSGNAAAATAFKEARALNSRVAKAKTIQKLYDDAEVSVGANHSISGMETALRQQFKALAKNERKLRGFSKQERAAIRHVAMGGKLENALRQLGKFAPQGVISGYGAIAATAVNPFLAAVPIVGGASKYASTKMAMRNAQAASDLVRKGPNE